ncbi:MAG: hypothetical protein UZ04_CHB001002250 [Chlorobi bacterium OLB4]|jgi:hypothetical protein|nr:MAG: hypothetical protein UZ04_CHB001002250 [Chlorobi bacterium OLB4]OQY78534.1 MAG: hypothetical protein B6D43_02325 [Ignavibacteriales bacterium UTCHB1]
MKIFAALLGTDKLTTIHEDIYNRLIDISIKRGYTLPDTFLRINPDQIPLDKWTLTLKGPHDRKAEFLLSVTAPKIPGMSPIPIRKDIDGKLFSVTVMDSYFGIWDDYDYTESRIEDMVIQKFEEFLDNLQN